MQESVIYQDIIQASLDQGRAEDRIEGRREEAYSLTIRLLDQCFGTLPIDLQSKISALPINQIELLSEAILDFDSLEDLVRWLQTRSVVRDL
jgi:predicted transposase YdaD